MADFPTDLSAVTDNVDDVVAKHLNNVEGKIGVNKSTVTTSLDYYIRTGWINPGETWTYASATTITVPAGAVARYSKGDKIRFQNNGSGTWLYAYIITVADTLLTVAGNAVPDATLTDNFYSHIENPLGFPTWFTWVPSFSATGSMTYTSVTASVAVFCIKNDIVFYDIYAGGTTGGTASNGLIFTLPVNRALTTTNYLMGYGRVYDGVDVMGMILSNSTNVDKIEVRRYDQANYGLGAGRYVTASGFYRY